MNMEFAGNFKAKPSIDLMRHAYGSTVTYT